jgi:hypothetical protein
MAVIFDVVRMLRCAACWSNGWLTCASSHMCVSVRIHAWCAHIMPAFGARLTQLVVSLHYRSLCHHMTIPAPSTQQQHSSMHNALSKPRLPQCVDMFVCHSIIAQVVVCEITLVTLAAHYGTTSTSQNSSLCRVSHQVAMQYGTDMPASRAACQATVAPLRLCYRWQWRLRSGQSRAVQTAPLVNHHSRSPPLAVGHLHTLKLQL